jgi:hypothetical protein
MAPFLVSLDPYLIWLFRITGYTFIDFLIGAFTLGMIATLIGELTISMAYRVNHRRIRQTTDDAVRYQDLAAKASLAGDGQTYRFCNDLANDAFGKAFFMQIALGSASLWPAFFAMAWMESRFSDVEFPLLWTEQSVGYPCVFIAMYVACRLLFNKTMRRLPYFKRVYALVKE